MRLAAGLVASLASACSVLYDPDRLPVDRADAGGPGIDAGVVEITGIEHGELLEGRGTGGSRPGVIRVTGRNLSASTGFAAEWDDGQALGVLETVVASDGTAAVLTVVLPVDAQRPNGTRSLNIRVGDSAAPIVRSVDVVMLPELMLPVDTPRMGARYSRVAVNSPGVEFTTSAAIVIRSMSEISLEASVSVDADRTMPGPGACTETCPGAGGPGAMNKGGGGGGFGSAGLAGVAGGGAGGVAVGNPELLPFGGVNRGQPGGTGASLAPGGAGGGSIALWADGNVGIGGDVTARGGDAPFVSKVSGGGGGSGGALRVHAGNMVAFGVNAKLRAPGGTGARPTASNGGDGGAGRVRLDASAIVGSPSIAAAIDGGVSYRGPSFSPLPPVIATREALSIRVVAEPMTAVTLSGTIARATATTDPVGVVTFEVTLARGVNRVCLSLANVEEVVDLEESCIDVALP